MFDEITQTYYLNTINSMIWKCVLTLCKSENFSQKPCVLSRPVRTKTFSAHHGAKFRHVVRKSGAFTHGKNSHAGGVSGGSLRSSRQAVTCHPFTRSWTTMPPEAPPPPDCLKSHCESEIVRTPIHGLKRILDSHWGMFDFSDSLPRRAFAV